MFEFSGWIVNKNRSEPLEISKHAPGGQIYVPFEWKECPYAYVRLFYSRPRQCIPLFLLPSSRHICNMFVVSSLARLSGIQLKRTGGDQLYADLEPSCPTLNETAKSPRFVLCKELRGSAYCEKIGVNVRAPVSFRILK